MQAHIAEADKRRRGAGKAPDRVPGFLRENDPRIVRSVKSGDEQGVRNDAATGTIHDG